MRKNGSRMISIRQYRLTDLFLFAVILVVFELVVHFAYKRFGGGPLTFTFSPMVPIVLMVMMRWGWPSVFYALGDGLLYCLLNLKTTGFSNDWFAVYIIGNAFIMLLLLMTRFVGTERIRKKWYFSALFLLAGWVSVVVGRTVLAVCFGYGFVPSLVGQLLDVMSLAVGLVIILIVRRLDGMFEDQKHYLKRLDGERKEKQRRDTFGDEPIELDEQSLTALKRHDDDLYN